MRPSLQDPTACLVFRSPSRFPHLSSTGVMKSRATVSMFHSDERPLTGIRCELAYGRPANGYAMCSLERR